MNHLRLPPRRLHNGKPLSRCHPAKKSWPLSGKNRAQRQRISAGFSAMAAGRRFT